MAELCDTAEIDEESARLRSEQAVIAKMMTEQINMNARVAIKQDEYQRQFEEYEAQYKEIQERIDALDQQRTILLAKMDAIRKYIDTLRFQKRITGFNETLWLNTVEKVSVGKDGTMVFEFKDGQCVEG